jgi:hypothetical protein
MVKTVITFNIICRIEWSGRPGLNRGLLRPSQATLFLKTKDLAKNLVVGRSTKMWLGTRKAPPNFPHSEQTTKKLVRHAR